MLALAAALRAWRLDQGLPAFLDEAIPYRQALAAWDGLSGAVDWNPHLFHYPSLPFELSLGLQKLHYAWARATGAVAGPADWLVRFQTDPTGPVLLARAAFAAVDLLAVACAIRIGERLRSGAGWLAGVAVAASATMILTGRRMYVDTLMAALAVAAVERALAWRAHGGNGRLAAAAALAGLATGCKYPAAALLAPLAVALWAREGPRGWWRVVPVAAVAALAFLATTPWVLLDRASFARDVAFLGNLAGEGHFGNFERAGLAFHAANLVRDLGPAAIGLLAASPVWTVVARRATDPGPRLVLWTALLAFAIPAAAGRVEVERYLVPVVPFAALLAADAGLGLAARARGRARPAATAAAVLALAGPALVSGVAAARLDADATRLDARRWVEGHLARGDLLVQELYGAPVLERTRALEVRGGRVFAAASAEARAAYEALPTVNAVTLPVAVVGRATVAVAPPGGAPVTLEIAPRAAELNAASYDPRLLAGATHVLTSAAVRGRHEADPARYPAAVALYARLDSTAEVAARFAPRGPRAGPEIVIYRMTDRARAGIAALGPLPTLWWAETMPAGYRDAAERALLPPGERDRPGLVDEQGEPRAWVRSLGPLFADRWAPMLRGLAVAALERGDADAAMRLAGAVTRVAPEDVFACLAYTTAAARLGRWAEARRELERARAALGPEATPPVLALEHAAALERLGERDAARRALAALATSTDTAIAAEARRRLGGGGP
uniref:Glycosyltransferase RgtA/B/C/D-like domain-containing protein n=1 Tax=Eiseniibacteriota bacterium TaxID=2212470 RepID=A0A832MKM0_UNCEI